MCSSVCWIKFANRCVVESGNLKPESGCSGPHEPLTAPSATEFEMKHETTRDLSPTLLTLAADGIVRYFDKTTMPNASGVRLFKG